MTNLHISLFGRFNVESNGKPFTHNLDARKVQELFSYLLLYRNRVHPRESLSDLLWGEISGAQARKYLRQALWQLQSALKEDFGGDELLVVDPEWVGLNINADVGIDVAILEDAYAKVQGRSGHEIDFQTARELVNAVELKQASLLEGWYHDWCIFERERLESMHLAMLNKLMIYFESRHEYETGLLYGQQILQSDRAHERTHWRMMRLHYLAGDRTSALRQYERCADALQEELGVKPAKWTVALYEQVRADELGDLTLAESRPNTVEPNAKLNSTLNSPVHLNRLQSLLQEFHKEVQQYIQVASLPPREKREADPYPAE